MPRITFRIGAFQPLSVMKIMQKKIRSKGNRRPIHYENWNGAIAIRYDGNIILKSWENKKYLFERVYAHMRYVCALYHVKQNFQRKCIYNMLEFCTNFFKTAIAPLLEHFRYISCKNELKCS